MRIFLALIVAPLLALGAQSTMFSLVTPSCAMQTRLTLHAVAALALVATAYLALQSHREWEGLGAAAVGDDLRTQGAGQTRRLLAVAGAAVAALSSLLVLVMWFETWVLSPCSPP